MYSVGLNEYEDVGVNTSWDSNNSLVVVNSYRLFL